MATKQTKKTPGKKTKPKTKAAKVAVAPPTKKGLRLKVPAKIKLPKYQKYAGNKPEKPLPKLTGAFRLFADCASVMRQYWKLFGGIMLIYFAMIVLLVGGLSGGLNVSSLKQTFSQELSQTDTIIAIFTMLIKGGGKPGSETGASFHLMVILLISLATIWALRQTIAGEKVKARDAFYKGMYPLVPFVLVIGFISLQLVPALIGTIIYSIVLGTGLAVAVWEKALWISLVASLVSMSLYWVSRTVFALYLVTLPNMRPWQAITSAKDLVRHRRWALARKLLFLPAALLVIGAIILVPLIMFAPWAVVWTFTLLAMLGLLFAHTYLYCLYRELL